MIDICKNVTIKLNEKSCKEIIANYLTEHSGFGKISADKIEFEMGTRCVGYFQDESYEPYFMGCSVICVMK